MGNGDVNHAHLAAKISFSLSVVSVMLLAKAKHSTLA